MVLPFVQVFSRQRPSKEHSIAAEFYAKEAGEKSQVAAIKHSIDFLMDATAVSQQAAAGEAKLSLEIGFEVWLEEFLRDNRSFQLLTIKKG